MSKAGCPYDNAPMERFYNTFIDDFKDTIIVNSEDYIIHDIKNFTNRDNVL